MTLVAEGPPKYCPECGFMRPRSDFYARHASNGILYAHSLCKEHDKQASWERQKRDRDKGRAAGRATHARRMKDPERAAIRRDKGRNERRRRMGTPPERYRYNPSPLMKAGGRRLSPEPFAAWLTTLGVNSEDIAFVVGMDPRQVRVYLAREHDVQLDVVDRALVNAGVPQMLDDLYPLAFNEEAA